ncbi:MAG: NAD-dependent dihydropyrimidine dehydrogenase subunit PreA [Deltaproteobacteria bacterium]|nr:MAG: NAD-dependent dihydropyrimidine dehydrogenase subunit PreA [Deltaproteobacteria bacterium]
MAATLSVTMNGIEFENPFLLGSGPPGTNAKVIAKSFDLGWGGNVCKTISLDASKVINTNPRYAKLRDRKHPDVVIGFENIELISDRPFETWIEELTELKKRYPRHVLVASIMEEYEKSRWQEITDRVQKTGVDALELNLSCPHGLPERKMGMAMGENPDLVEEVVGWVKEVATIPVWAKMTPNVGSITAAPLAAVRAGADGISAINTILCVIGVDLKTLRPLPNVEGHTVPGGYSGQAVRPIALRQIMEIARACPETPISGMGGIDTGYDAAQFILMGSTTVQVCTGAMLQGYECISKLKEELLEVMHEHGFETLDEMRGKALDAFTTHANLVELQRKARAEKVGTAKDNETWQGEIAKETDALTSN